MAEFLRKATGADFICASIYFCHRNVVHLFLLLLIVLFWFSFAFLIVSLIIFYFFSAFVFIKLFYPFDEFPPKDSLHLFLVFNSNETCLSESSQFELSLLVYLKL